MKFSSLLALPFVLAVATASAIPQLHPNPLAMMEERSMACGQLCLESRDCSPPCATCDGRTSVCSK